MLQVLSDPSFLHGFGTVLLIALLTSLIFGGLGIAAGKLVQLSDFLSHSVSRFLRLAIWLTFFVFWALPIWGPGKTTHSEIGTWVITVVNGVVAAAPTVLLATCYFYLSSRVVLKSEGRRLRFPVARPVFLLALLISLLWQLYLPSAWPWRWLATGIAVTATSLAAFILVAAVVILTNLLYGWGPDIDAQLRPAILASELQRSDSRSLVGALAISALCLFLWHLTESAWKRVFLIERPAEIASAIQRLLITGATDHYLSGATLWWDIQLSLLEIAGGIAVGGSVAFLIAQASSKGVSSKLAWALYSLTCVAPVVLAAQIVMWAGVMTWQKVLTIACLTIFPLSQSLWSNGNLSVWLRFLIAIQEGLPYAFLGMLLAEAYAATAGLGFRIILFRATLFISDSIAAAIIAFSLLAILSCLFRFAIKQLYLSGIGIRTISARAES